MVAAVDHMALAGAGGRIALLDAMIHHQDIRRPLGRPREIPADRLLAALTFARTAPPIGTPRRAVAGRGSALSELPGPGVATLAGRTRP